MLDLFSVWKSSTIISLKSAFATIHLVLFPPSSDSLKKRPYCRSPLCLLYQAICSLTICLCWAFSAPRSISYPSTPNAATLNRDSMSVLRSVWWLGDADTCAPIELTG